MKTIKNMTADQLRKSILQLAIQGKLVKQDPKDEPASVLVEKIYEEKKKLIAEGKIKKEKVESRIFKGDDNRYYEKIGKETKDITDELPFEIPENWEWIRINNYVKKVTDFVASGSFASLRENVKYYKTDNYAIMVKTQDFQNQFTKDLTFTDKQGYDFLENSNLFGGELVLSNVGSIGKIFIVPKLNKPMTLAPNAIMIRLFNEKHLIWIYYVFQSIFGLELLLSISSATAIKKFNKTDFKTLLIPIPPLSEQKRIIDRIEQIEPLLQQYDKLEKQLTKLENEITDKLKKSILQYAIEGKLVKQDPNDEPASVLLERIKAEKEKLLKEGKIKRDKNESYIYQGDDKNYYENPGFIKPYNWHFCKLINISNYIHRGKSPKYGQSDLPIIAQKCNKWKGIEIEKCLYADEKTKNLYTVEQFININDIIVNSTGTGTVGLVNIITSDIFNKYDNFVTDSHITLIKLNSLINCKFVYYFLKSPEIQSDIESKCTGSTNQIELGTDTIKNFYICLPPLTEQQRIVNKVERLFNVL